MDVRVKIDASRIKAKVLASAQSALQAKAEEVVTNAINNYVADLEAHMGSISGASGYSEGKIRWSPLSPESLEKEDSFWYESGKIRNSLVVNIETNGGRISASLAIADKEAYNEYLWNELGFTADSGKLIRRPLFIPLAEEHLGNIREQILKELAGIKLEVRMTVK